MHADMDIYKHIQNIRNTHTYAYTDIHVYIHTHVNTCTYTYISVHINTLIYTYANVCA